MASVERSIMIIPGDGPGLEFTNGTSPITDDAVLKDSKSIVITVANPSFDGMQSYAMVASTSVHVAASDANANVLLRLHYDTHAPYSFTDAKSVSTFCNDSSLRGLTPTKAELFFKK